MVDAILVAHHDAVAIVIPVCEQVEDHVRVVRLVAAALERQTLASLVRFADLVDQQQHDAELLGEFREPRRDERVFLVLLHPSGRLDLHAAVDRDEAHALFRPVAHDRLDVLDVSVALVDKQVSLLRLVKPLQPLDEQILVHLETEKERRAALGDVGEDRKHQLGLSREVLPGDLHEAALLEPAVHAIVQKADAGGEFRHLRLALHAPLHLRQRLDPHIRQRAFQLRDVALDLFALGFELAQQLFNVRHMPSPSLCALFSAPPRRPASWPAASARRR